MIFDLSQQVQREFNFVIVDEVDSILIDEARVPLIISGEAEDSAEKYSRFSKVVLPLEKGIDFEIDEKLKLLRPAFKKIADAENALSKTQNAAIQKLLTPITPPGEK